MAIAFLATGDELVYGDTVNTNSGKMAKHLSSSGIGIGNHLVCSDDEQDIINSLKFLNQKHKTIIITGGLGPTTDDKTRFALAKFVNEPLICYDRAIQHIQERLDRAQLKMCEGNRQQALFPKGTTLIENPNGTAMGGYFTANDTLFILLPGPPKECIPMFEQQLIPLLSEQASSNSQMLKWMVFGYAESELARKLESALEGFDCQTGYRLDLPYIEFKVRCPTELAEQVKQRIEPLIQEDVFCTPELKASARLKQLIKTLGKTLCIRDDVTGGLLQSLIDSPETHRYLQFQADGASDVQVHLTGLKEYWQQMPYQGQTEIQFHASSKNGEPYHEAKQLPYRSPNVIHHAVEWLAFRLTRFLEIIHDGIA